MKKQFIKLKNKHRQLIASLLMLGLASTAMADFKEYKETKAYAGLGITRFVTEIKATNNRLIYGSEEFTGGTLRLGMPVHNYLSIEGRYALSKKATYANTSSSAYINHTVSGLMLLGPTEGKWRPYLAIGASSLGISFENAAKKQIKTREFSPSAGVGLALYTRRQDVGLSFEYLHLAEAKLEYKMNGIKAKQKTSVGALSITVLKHF